MKVTIEHGHANHLSDDWSSTAYWYQTLPTAKPITILPVEERIPNVPVLPERNLQMPELTEEMKEARESWAKRWEEYKPAKEKNSSELKKIRPAGNQSLILNLQRSFVKNISNNIGGTICQKN